MLSTPSLGITGRRSHVARLTCEYYDFQLPLSGSHGPGTSLQRPRFISSFNSLSRDHEAEKAAWRIVKKIETFNSLSRDHRHNVSGIRVKGISVLSTPSLGITSWGDILTTAQSIYEAFNSLSRDHLTCLWLAGIWFC